ncbi:MAG TPA: transporter substrate-binding domain-containing protein [Caulobacteraceae bacterium]|jgi:polar amino acid transport system substrate-binding protein
MSAVATPQVVAELAPTGVLRAAINMGNFLLVTGKAANGDPAGVAPDMARAIAERLGVGVAYVPYPRPNQLADAAEAGAWDIGLIGAEPQRAARIAFTDAYCEIEAAYLVPAGSKLATMAEVDAPGVRVVSVTGAAYTLWLERNLHQATLIQTAPADAAAKLASGAADVLAGLRPGLLGDIERQPGARILEGGFMTVQQAVGTLHTHAAGAAFLQAFVAEAKVSGLVARLIEKHGGAGRLSVAR